MAHLHNLTSQKHSGKLFQLYNMANEFQQRELLSVIKIQSWWRSLKTRMRLKFVFDCAITIQRTYRAFASRKNFRNMVASTVWKLSNDHYNKQVVKIQRRWRGYYVRKYKSDYYARKAFLKGLVIKNEKMSELLKEIGDANKRKNEAEATKKMEQAMVYNLRKQHYLVGTKVMPGVYNSDLEKEQAMRVLPPLTSSERQLFGKTKQDQLELAKLDEQVSVKKRMEEMKGKPLPPIKTSKVPQGPFRNPHEVLEQRYKAFCPSLRVQTEYESAEFARIRLNQKSWASRVVDEKFKPSTKGNAMDCRKSKLRTSSCYRRLDYGTKHFRGAVPKLGAAHTTPFQNVVSPIPLFDKFGKTY